MQTAVLRGAQNERRGAGVAAEGFACRRVLSGRFFNRSQASGVRGRVLRFRSLDSQACWFANSPWLRAITSSSGGSRTCGEFPAGPRRQAGEDADVHIAPQEMNRSVGEDRVRPNRMKAVSFVVVRAVDGAGAGLGR